jgi:hypothetical protein
MSDVSSRVGARVDAHLDDLSDRSPVSVHLDRLDASRAAGDVVETSSAAFAVLARATDAAPPAWRRPGDRGAGHRLQ